MTRFLYTLALLLLLASDIAWAQGQEWTFYVRNQGTFEYDEVQATLIYDGIYSRVWVDNREIARPNLQPGSSQMRTLLRALDTAVAGTSTNITPRDGSKGILRNDIDVFGDIPRQFNVEDKTDFLMLDLEPGILGYFSPHDQTENNFSNRMNLLYMDSREGLGSMTQLLSTIAHEFQHLIHHNRYPRPDAADPAFSFFNEGLSENANLFNGYYDRSNTGYLANTNIDLFTMHDDGLPQEYDYQRAMTFVRYMYEQFGEQFIYEFTGMREPGLTRITKTLEKLGIPGTGEAVLKNWAVANLLQIDPNPAFGYRLRLGSSVAQQNSPRRATVQKSYTGTAFPASEDILLQGHGVYYIRYTTPGPMQVRLGGSGDGRVMMVAERGGRTEISELQQGIDHTLPLWAGGPYERVTFAIVNAGSGAREVTWNAQSITAGVDVASGADATIAITGATVDAAASMLTVHATLASSDAARLDLFNLRGEIIRSVELDSRTGATDARIDVADLAAGGYIARVGQRGRSASTPFVIVH
jgi:hypothetical protein